MIKLITPEDDLPLDFSVCDFETTSGDKKVKALDPIQHKVLGIACGDKTNQFYVPLNHKDCDNVPLDKVKKWFQQWCSTTVWKNQSVKFDAKFAYHQLDCKEFKGLNDLRVPAFLVDENRQSYSLDAIYEQFTGETITKRALIQTALKQAGNSKDFGDVPIKLTFPYACKDVALTDEMFEKANAALDSSLNDTLDYENRLTKVLTHAEVQGTRIDVVECGKRAAVLMKQLIELQERMTDEIGIEFNPNSPQQVADIMGNLLGIPTIKKTDKGAPSWDADAIIKASQLYPHPLLDLLLKYSEIDKKCNSFYRPWFEKNINGRLYPEYNQIGAITGRMSCSNPNFQQVSKPDREVWLADEGHVLLFSDYSQIEYRFFAHYAGGRLRDAYCNDPNVDFHEWVMKQIKEIVGLDLDRTDCKRINFGTIYGMGEEKNKNTLSVASKGRVSKEDADLLFATYHREFPEVKQLLKGCESAAKKRGWVRNIFGRRRHLKRHEAFKAFNSLCQGGAADVAKRAMVHLFEAGYNVKWQVHDEIGIQVINEPPVIEKAAKEIREIMCAAAGDLLSVPISCDMEINTRWKKAS